MTRWQHFRSAFRLPPSALEITLVRPDRLPDAQVTKILQSAPEAHLLYRAFMQLLEDAEREAVDYVATNSWEPQASVTHAGGARYLRGLREDILQRRERKKTPNAERPTPIG